jgi:hypothetical protein
MTAEPLDDRYGLLSPPTSPPELLGRTEPRLWTPPLRELTPATSYGFEACEYAKDIGRPLDPWQEFLVVHAGELLPDGRPRFRMVLVLVSRQNGKTEVLVVLSLFWLFKEKRKLVLGTSLLLDAAKESWEKAVELAEEHEPLADQIATVRRANGEQTLTTVDKNRYKIAAANRRAGRSKTIDRLVMDEVREQDSFVAYNAAVPAMNAVYDGQAFLISNQGDDTAVVLDSLRKSAVAFIETGEGDPRLGLFEWSAPDGSDPEDVDALAQANPNLGINGGGRIELDNLLREARRAKEAGGEQLAGFRTEAMCMRVHVLDPAIDPDRWVLCKTEPRSMESMRDRVALCLDVSLDGQHATLAAAVVEPGGRVRLEVVKAWSGFGCTTLVRRELPAVVARVKPRVFGWYPNSPAAAVAADLADPKKRHGRRMAWPPPGVTVEEIRAEVPAVCMGLADLVNGRQIAHSDDELMNLHVSSAQKLWTGNTWVFARKGSGPIDAAYAPAGAAHLARTLPPPRSKLVVL